MKRKISNIKKNDEKWKSLISNKNIGRILIAIVFLIIVFIPLSSKLWYFMPILLIATIISYMKFITERENK